MAKTIKKALQKINNIKLNSSMIHSYSIERLFTAIILISKYIMTDPEPLD